MRQRTAPSTPLVLLYSVLPSTAVRTAVAVHNTYLVLDCFRKLYSYEYARYTAAQQAVLQQQYALYRVPVIEGLLLLSATPRIYEYDQLLLQTTRGYAGWKA